MVISLHLQSAYDGEVVADVTSQNSSSVPFPNLKDLMSYTSKVSFSNNSSPVPYLNLNDTLDAFNASSQNRADEQNVINYEIYLDVLLILLLVWFLNREFEISYRLSFHGNMVAARDKAKVQTMKDQAEMLLHNIIPEHVAEHLKTTAKLVC